MKIRYSIDQLAENVSACGFSDLAVELRSRMLSVTGSDKLETRTESLRMDAGSAYFIRILNWSTSMFLAMNVDMVRSNLPLNFLPPSFARVYSHPKVPISAVESIPAL